MCIVDILYLWAGAQRLRLLAEVVAIRWWHRITTILSQKHEYVISLGYRRNCPIWTDIELAEQILYMVAYSVVSWSMFFLPTLTKGSRVYSSTNRNVFL